MTETKGEYRVDKIEAAFSDSVNEILNDPSASTWLKVALHSAVLRDPVDAANDAEVLLEVLLEPILNAALIGMD